MCPLRFIIAVAVSTLALSSPAASGATPPRIDAEQCKELRGEQVKFIESGILADLARGPDWAKANLTADKLRQIELFIMLDEQLKFGCRDAHISPDAARAGQAAIDLEKPSEDPKSPAAAPGSQTPAANAAAANGDDPPAKPANKPKRQKKKPVDDAYKAP